MKKMNQKSAGALMWFAALLFIVGFMIMSPSGSFFLFAVSALILVFPSLFGSGRIRIAAAVLLLAATLLAVTKYPDFKKDQEQYRLRNTKGVIEKINCQPASRLDATRRI